MLVMVFLLLMPPQKKCAKMNFRGVDSIQHKHLHLVAYLCELGYGLALSSIYNVSCSPGFETPLGIFLDMLADTSCSQLLSIAGWLLCISSPPCHV
jgi:hypothetical protein